MWCVYVYGVLFPSDCALWFSHRQLALKALNERLKKVEDQSAWPSMDDEEDDEEDEVRTDTPLLSGRETSSPAGGAGSPQTSTGEQESSIISFEDAPSRS